MAPDEPTPPSPPPAPGADERTPELLSAAVRAAAEVLEVSRERGIRSESHAWWAVKAETMAGVLPGLARGAAPPTTYTLLDVVAYPLGLLVFAALLAALLSGLQGPGDGSGGRG